MDFEALGVGKKAPEIVTTVVEIPKGSHNKYEYDEETGVFKLDRVLYSPMHYPLDYGFIPQTRSEDGDHLDMLIIGSDPVFTGCVVDVRPIGVFHMIDSGEPDAKILGVQAKNPRFDTINDLKDVELYNPHLLKEISHFFKVYKDLQGKEVQIQGWEDKAAAIAEITKAQEAFKHE
jgi:inorganic pyrophosphatase